jgi:hypothetical protein
MKRTFLTAAIAVALSSGLALAQAPQQTPPPDGQAGAPPHHFRHHKPSPEHEAAHLTKALNLTPDQTARLEPILADRDQKMAALWQDQNLAPQDKHAQMKAIHQSTEQQLATVLTPDQLQQMKAMRHEHGPRGPHGQWQGHPQQQPPPPPAGL